MFLIENFNLFFVDSTHGARGDGDFVAVGVVAGLDEGFELSGGGGRGGREGVVEDAEGGEVGGGEGGAGVVGEAAVALVWEGGGLVLGWGGGRGGEGGFTGLLSW